MDERTLNDLLECSVCLERLDTSSKVLPCQHTFCRKCLEVIFSSRQELRCPECRVLVDVKIEELPPNVLLMRILEGMKNATTAKAQNEITKIQIDNKVENTQKQNEEQQQQIKLNQQKVSFQQQQQVKQKQQIHLQQQQLQQHATNGINSATAIAPPQYRRSLVPHAKALYDFESHESTDLKFKKGDVIFLKRKVDINWYVGEINGAEGTFPSNYVQVVVPLPLPLCIALYDFKMGPNEEEGCLTFKKGTLIHVLRRVDHNWAEGRINSTIGIFPIAFVELNPLAKQLLDSYVVLNSPPPPPDVVQDQQQQEQLRNKPVQQLYNANLQLQLSQQNQPLPTTPRNLPPIPTDSNVNTTTPDTTPSSSSRSSQTSPNSNTTSCSSNSSSTSLQSTPNQSNPTSPQNSSSVRYRDSKEKRHSLNALPLASSGGDAASAISILQTNRHSAEILSMPNDITHTLAAMDAQNLHILPNSHEGLASTQTTTAAVFNAPAASLLATGQSFPAREQQQLPIASTSRANVLKSSGQQNIPPALPWGYLALYPYKPRKLDELELKKGCVYVVTERCLDGWFKGKNWQDISGVFPGNYVTPLRNQDQQQLMHQWKFVQTHSPLQKTVQANMTQNKLHIAGNLSHQPPELPPRQTTSGMLANPTPSSSSTTSNSVWSKPLGHTVEAFFSRKTHNTPEKPDDNCSTQRQKENSATSNTSAGASSTAVSLIKRLAQIKTRSKSPGHAVANNIMTAPNNQQSSQQLTCSIDNTSFDDPLPTNQQGTAHINHAFSDNLHPVHVRSGSCPSQLLQSLPTDLKAAQNSETYRNLHQYKQQNSTQQQYGGSQRIKGGKERPQLQNVRQLTEVNLHNTLGVNIVSQIQQQQSLTKCGRQAQNQHQAQPCNMAIYHRKSQSLDANTISAQPNNSDGTEVGRMALSTQNPRESRFRCVVSYPPNSELELELHVGDIVYVHRKQKSGWYKGTHARTNKTGLFPASFVEPDV